MQLKRILAAGAVLLCVAGCSRVPAGPSSVTAPAENVSTPASESAPAPKDVSNFYTDDIDYETDDQAAVEALYWYLYSNLAPKDYTSIVLYRGQVDLKAMEKAPIDTLLRDYDGPWAPIYFRQTTFSRVDLMQAKAAIKALYQGRPGGPQLMRLDIYEGGEPKVLAEVVEIDDELTAFVENYPIQDIFEISRFVPEEDINPD